MSKSKKKNQRITRSNDPLERIALPEVKLDSSARQSIFIVVIFALGLVSLLGLFNLSGRFGNFLSENLSLAFGWGRWAWPLFLLAWGWLLYKGKKHHINGFHYIGLFSLFISYQTLFHFFFKTENQKLEASLGQGGGYVGYYLSWFFNNILGFWGGLIVLLALFFIALILLFNTPLNKLIGGESFWMRALKSVRQFFRQLFNDEANEDESGIERVAEAEEEDEADEDEELAAAEAALLASEKLPLGSTGFVRKEIGENNGSDFALEVASLEKKRRVPKIDMPLELLTNQTGQAMSGDIERNAILIKHTLENFGIPVEMGETSVGPTVTQYTFKPAEGIKLSRITALNNDLSLALAAHPIRIEAPIPGKALVGIEVPNKTKAIVGLRNILDDKAFKNRSNNLMVALGKDVAGANWLYDVTKMPHLLVAGATNSGKSVCLNAIIVSLLYQNGPSDLRFIMVDPKRVELPAYNGIPHLLTPVITEVPKTINALKWCLNEMDRRYDILNKTGKKNIQSYNTTTKEKLPYIVFVIDELADLMVAAAKDIEGSIIRLTQMSRAVGIHLILATQRPSVDVITGLIKANIPARIAFSVASAIDSKTILDCSGAEKLLGKGDMLFSAAEMSKPKRLQGAYLSDEEINRVTQYIKEKSGQADYVDGVTDRQKVSGIAGIGLDGISGDEDQLLAEAREIVVNMGRASTSLLQRRLRIGYSRAASILDALEEAGVVGPANGSKPREILVTLEQYERQASTPLAGARLHDRRTTSAPESYLVSPTEEGNDDTLEFDSEEEPEVEAEAEPEAEAKEEIEASEPAAKTEPKTPRAFDDEEDGMFFSK